MSPSSRRAWIEINLDYNIRLSVSVALLAEGVDRNKVVRKRPKLEKRSPSSRRAWIEIPYLLFAAFANCVALLAEGVDRNAQIIAKAVDDQVVALLAEGVDRNTVMPSARRRCLPSPSSRRAWIEILPYQGICRTAPGRPPRGGRG